MKSPESGHIPPQEKHDIKEIMLFENRISDLFFAIASKFSGKIKSFQLMRDDDFVHRNDRKTNDIHLFFELKNGQYFHLRAYTRHMLDMDQLPIDKISLTGYLKPSISQTGGTHSLRQDWYQWDSETIANEVITQNQSLFS